MSCTGNEKTKHPKPNLAPTSLRAPDPEISSNKLVKSLGDICATFSISPWNTRKFLALTKIPYDSNRVL